MSKEIYISSTPHETRLAIVEKDELSEIYYERENEYTLAGSIYNGRVTRVLPGMQSSFVDIGLERDAFLYITDFLEEQGESADFDGGGAVAREGRSERGGEGRRSRNGRPGERSGRGEREDRGRRETRPSDEGGSEESAQQQDSGLPAQAASRDLEDGRSEESELGEGAPGADGSRRWRGRRGRRRGGRATEDAQGNGVASESTPEGAGALESLRASDEGAGYTPPPEGDAGRSQSGNARERSGRDNRQERGGRGGRDSRSGRDTGGDRWTSTGDRSGRGSETRGGRDRFADSSRDPQGGTADAERGPAAEPFILPGESLARYRRGIDGDTAGADAAVPTHPASATPLARPSSEFQLTEAWDGGATLPGETLARHREAPVARGSGDAEADFRSSSSSPSFRSGNDRRRERDQRRGPRPERPAPSLEPSLAPSLALDPSIAVQPAVTSQHEPEATMLPLSDDAPGFELQATEDRQEFEAARAHFEAPVDYEPQTDLAPPSTEVSPALLEAVEEFHEIVSEYEPGDDAAASYRVDPAAPSEFRQDSLVADDLDHLQVRFPENEPGGDDRQASPGDAAGHEFTAVQPSGEMISEDPLVPEAVADRSLEAQLASPIEQETVVQSVSLQEAETIPYPIQDADQSFPVPSDATEAGADGEAHDAADPHAFAPGAGALEEELLEDEDGDPLALHASNGFDDTEEETLEGTADLGVMLRDMAVDEITRAEPVDLDEEEDDDFDLDIDEMEEDELDSSEELAGSDVSEVEEDDFAESADLEFAPEEEGAEEQEGSSNAADAEGQPARARRGRGRRGQRDSRPRQPADSGQFRDTARDADQDPGRQPEGADTGGGYGDSERDGDRGDAPREPRRERSSRDIRRPGGRAGGRMSRHTAQTTDLPAISDLLKPGQELLVQIAKEPIAKKGARITSHIALPGRFLVFMPTVKHVGVSRKIESDAERRRLKEILLSEKGEAQGGFIVRTAASGASEEELRSDLRFLLNLWTDIKQRSEGSKSPALIYHDLNLVERVLRDQVTDTFSAIWVDTEAEYERVLRFLQRFQPSMLRRVKLYSKDTPLFEQFGIAEEINKALRSKVWLKSGGSIVINQTEALVAIDINTGKYVGKTARLEDTIVKTNLDAIPEIVRQVRLRDLGGIIVIDFIDMDDRKNRHRVLAALEEELKKDRAPSKVLNFNDFGLVIITRKRVKQSLERTLSTTCNVCVGTGMTKSPVTVCNEIYIELRKMYRSLDKGDIMLRVNPEVVKALKSNNARWLTDLEELSGKTILLKSDPSLHPEQFDIH